MMTSSTGNIIYVTGPLCGEFTGRREIPVQRPVARSFDISFDLRLEFTIDLTIVTLVIWDAIELTMTPL